MALSILFRGASEDLVRKCSENAEVPPGLWTAWLHYSPSSLRTIPFAYRALGTAHVMSAPISYPVQ
jgi:hypothetical protein